MQVSPLSPRANLIYSNERITIVVNLYIVVYNLSFSERSYSHSYQSQTRRNDGDEPDYMAENPTEWLSSTMESCCQKFFAGYQFEMCMGGYLKDDDDCIQELYYPDWAGSNEGCIADGR
jgi:hypothetical protein